MVPAGGRRGHGAEVAPPAATPRMPDGSGGVECETAHAAGVRHAGTRAQWTPPEGRLDGRPVAVLRGRPARAEIGQPAAHDLIIVENTPSG